MTYGRARLWLGITGVGSLVMIAGLALAWGLPQRLLENEAAFGWSGILQLVSVTGVVMLWLAPLDFLGGYWLPGKFEKSGETFAAWLKKYVTAALLQATLFVSFGSTFILASQFFGWPGGLISIGLFMIACFVFRDRWVLAREYKSGAVASKLQDATAVVKSWQIDMPRIAVVEHSDPGFTGGVTGWGKNSKIVIPRAWLAFSTEQLATAIARRALAIQSGSYARGLLLAFVWNLTGIIACSLMPGAGLESVAALVTTICGFTLWSFFGLLVLPTPGRKASLKIDQELVRHGVKSNLISSTASAMDQLQDDEPDRSRLIETIFHPVPSVASRQRIDPVSGFAAWNVARTTLFLSWACLGFLSRAVHCNVGRPELWVMLPTD